MEITLDLGASISLARVVNLLISKYHAVNINIFGILVLIKIH